MNIHVLGLGAIGSNLLTQLASVYPDFQYHGYDMDKVEERNLKTQAYFLEHKGHPKSLALKAVLARKIPKIHYVPHNGEIVKPIEVGEKDLVIDCFDNSKSRKITKQIKNGDLLHIGFSPEFTAEIAWEGGKNDKIAGDVSGEIDICTLNFAGPFIRFVVSFAAIQIIDFIDNGVKKDWAIIDKVKIRG